MPSIALDLDKREKAFIYIIYRTQRHYISGTVLGIVIAVLVLFGGTPNYTALATPIIGLLFACVDIKCLMYLLTHKVDVCIQGFEWHTMLYPYNKTFPFSVYRKDLKLLSIEGMKTFMLHIKLSLLYEAYRWLILIILIAPNLIISGKAEVVAFNWGLSIFFLGVSYLLLWGKIYISKSGRVLGLTEKRALELKTLISKKDGTEYEKPLHSD